MAMSIHVDIRPVGAFLFINNLFLPSIFFLCLHVASASITKQLVAVQRDGASRLAKKYSL